MQVALAWLLQRSPNILLIPGTSSLEHLRENLAAATLKLPAEDCGSIGRNPHGRCRGRKAGVSAEGMGSGEPIPIPLGTT